MSDAFYQALSRKCDSLPRASKVKAARSELNKTVELFSRGGSRISEKKRGGGGGLLSNFIKTGEGAGGVPLPAS